MHFCTKQACTLNVRFPALSTALLALLLALLTGLTGCGGGGSGGGGGGKTGNGKVTLEGTLQDVATGNPPTSGTIAVNGSSTTMNADGTFTLSNVATTATTATITAAGETPQTLTLSIPKTATTVDLGTIYLSSSGYTATATGTVETMVNGNTQPVGGASVTIAGSTVLTATNGTFSIPNLPVGLGTIANAAIGSVTATGYVAKPILTQYVFVAGNNLLGQILIQTAVNATPPTLPYTISGNVTHSGTAEAGIAVELLSNGTLLGTTTTDTSGNYYFWVVPGTYSVATFINNVQGTPVTVTLASAATPVTQNLTY